MGNGSPRLLRILRCAGVIVCASLWFAPPAFADDGGSLVSTVRANAAVQVPAVPAVRDARTQLLSPVAPLETAATETVARVAPIPRATPTRRSPIEPKRPSFPEASAPANQTKRRGGPQTPRRSGHTPLPQGAGHRAGADAPPARAQPAAPSTGSDRRVRPSIRR
jgi:hypothetical protein